MKKLMIAAAIVCAAVLAQASTVTWGLDGDILTGDPTDENYTYGNAWIIALGTTGDITGLSVNTDGEVVLGTSMSIAATGEGKIEDGGLTTMTSVVNADGYYALLLADGDTYQWTTLVAQASGVTANDDTKVLSVSFGSDGATLDNSPTSGGSTPEGVPEPTSGLLLLLGMAGLALKRKIA